MLGIDAVSAQPGDRRRDDDDSRRGDRTMIEADVNVAIEQVQKWRDAHHLAPVEVAQVRAQSVAFALRKRLRPRDIKGLVYSKAAAIIKRKKQSTLATAADVTSAFGAISALAGSDVASGPLATVAHNVGQQNEEQMLNAAIQQRLAEKADAFERLILSDAQGADRGRLNTVRFGNERGHLVRLGASTAAASKWLKDKVAEQQGLLQEQPECVIM